jgi:hypothetical protein
MNSSFAFAALAVLSAFPFLAVTSSVIGGDIRRGIVARMGLNEQVTEGQKSYGPAGVVIALITFLVGFGVCLHAGAVFGRMWNERQAERALSRSRS